MSCSSHGNLWRTDSNRMLIDALGGSKFNLEQTAILQFECINYSHIWGGCSLNSCNKKIMSLNKALRNRFT